MMRAAKGAGIIQLKVFQEDISLHSRQSHDEELRKDQRPRRTLLVHDAPNKLGLRREPSWQVAGPNFFVSHFFRRKASEPGRFSVARL